MVNRFAKGIVSARGLLLALLVALVTAFFLNMAIARGLRGVQPQKPPGTKLDQLGLQLAAPAFELTGQDGKSFSSTELRGFCWVGCFVFTRCSGICARMSGSMGQLQQQFGSKEKLRLISFTVDPEFDTPEILARYADLYHARPGFWRLLTGRRPDIHRLCQEGFKLGVEQSSEGLITHSSRLVLVDGAGFIRAFYENEEPGELQQLTADLAYLLETTQP